MKTQTSRSLCERCGTINPADAQFCIACGYSLEAATTGATTRLHGRPCLNCRTVNPEDARFCVVCGRTFDPQPAPVRPPRGPAPQPRPPHQHAPWASPHPRRRYAHAPSTALGSINVGMVLVIGLFVLLATHTFWPGILLLMGLGVYVNGINTGRVRQATPGLVWLAGLTVLFAFHAFWPGIIVLVGLNWLLTR